VDETLSLKRTQVDVFATEPATTADGKKISLSSVDSDTRETTEQQGLRVVDESPRQNLFD
jgi:hypothetical protein